MLEGVKIEKGSLIRYVRIRKKWVQARDNVSSLQVKGKGQNEWAQPSNRFLKIFHQDFGSIMVVGGNLLWMLQGTPFSQQYKIRIEN